MSALSACWFAVGESFGSRWSAVSTGVLHGFCCSRALSCITLITLPMLSHRMNKLIICCMRLHNICVDRHVSTVSALPADGCIARNRELVQMRPRFDRDGIPVSLLTWHGDEGQAGLRRNAPDSSLPGCASTTGKRDALIEEYRRMCDLRPVRVVPPGGR